jgi:hypothetical protein
MGTPLVAPAVEAPELPLLQPATRMQRNAPVIIERRM